MSDATITRLRPADRERWGELWGAYLAFYETSLPLTTYDVTWNRLTIGSGALHGFGVRATDDEDAPLAGIAHYVFHASAWTPTDVCYLQDLYVDASSRRRGFARQLIEAVTEAARDHGCARLYWLTHHTNATARRLYDTVAADRGFIEYERSLC